MKPPQPKKIPKIHTAHGDERIDDYYWLRDDTRKNPEVITRSGTVHRSDIVPRGEYIHQFRAHSAEIRATLWPKCSPRHNTDS